MIQRTNQKQFVELKTKVAFECAAFAFARSYKIESQAMTLKNAHAREDAAGDIWLFIEGGGLKQAILLSDATDKEESIKRRCVKAWLADQEEDQEHQRPNRS